MKTIKQEVLAIKRKYKFIKGKFLYNNKKRDFKIETQKIVCYFLCFSPHVGHTVFNFTFRRAVPKNYKTWKKWLTDKGIEIFSSAVLDAINNKDGSGQTKYILKEFIAWGLQNDFSKLESTKTIKRRNNEKQTRKTKKRGGHRR